MSWLTKDDWTDAEITELLRFVDAGMSAGAAARSIPGRTRSACIGKARRLGRRFHSDVAPRYTQRRALRRGERLT